MASRLKRLKCSVLTAARLHAQQKKKWKVAMLTLTYRPEAEWHPRQVTETLRNIRKYLYRKQVEFRYVWVQELTKQGRPHYHCLVWLPLGMTLPKPDKQGWWKHGMTKIEWAKNAIGYIAKYASKGSGPVQFKKGARLHGNGGVTGEALLEQRWWKLPAWLRNEANILERWVSRKGGGYVSKLTGEIRESPWEVVFQRGEIFIRRKNFLM